MVGSVFPEIVRDLKREGWTEKANDLEGYMHDRERRWERLRYPFGSEMPWDSTGQEEIYTWCRYFGAEDKAKVTLSAILGYMPTVPNWAYNGAGRRYFDAPVNGTRWPQVVRMTNHYGSASTRSRSSTPTASIRTTSISFASATQVWTRSWRTSTRRVSAPTASTADPAILQFDPYTADFGIAFYGYARNAGAYIMKHPEFGWLGFGCEVRERASEVEVLPVTASAVRSSSPRCTSNSRWTPEPSSGSPTTPTPAPFTSRSRALCPGPALLVSTSSAPDFRRTPRLSCWFQSTELFATPTRFNSAISPAR